MESLHLIRPQPSGDTSAALAVPLRCWECDHCHWPEIPEQGCSRFRAHSASWPPSLNNRWCRRRHVQTGSTQHGQPLPSCLYPSRWSSGYRTHRWTVRSQSDPRRSKTLKWIWRSWPVKIRSLILTGQGSPQRIPDPPIQRSN